MRQELTREDSDRRGKAERYPYVGEWCGHVWRWEHIKHILGSNELISLAGAENNWESFSKGNVAEKFKTQTKMFGGKREMRMAGFKKRLNLVAA